MLQDDRWLTFFPELRSIEEPALKMLFANAVQAQSQPGQVAYREGDECSGYVLRYGGCSRVQKNSETGREIVLYRVGPGEACVLTTSCLLSGAHYPAESIVESVTQDIMLPSAAFKELMKISEGFRNFVLERYSLVIGDLMLLIDEVAFKRLDVRLAKWLADEAKIGTTIKKTHQQIAVELGSSREVVSRLLKEFERKDWLVLARGQIDVTDQKQLLHLANDVG